MIKQTRFLAYFAIIGLTLTGCSSTDSPVDDNGPSIPADAVTIDSFNAIDIATKALDTFHLLSNTLPNASDFETFTCPNGGDYTDSWTTEINGESGQMNFNSCSFISPLTLSGIYNYSTKVNPLTFVVTQTGDANSLSLDYSGALYKLNVEFSMDFNLDTNAYGISTDFSLSGIADQGLLFTTTSPMTGTIPGGVESGQVLVSGANNTRLRITVINGGTDVNVELDNGSGSYVQSEIINIVSATSPAT